MNPFSHSYLYRRGEDRQYKEWERCQNCEEDWADYFCQSCDIYLCNDCVEKHYDHCCEIEELHRFDLGENFTYGGIQ